MPAVWGRENSSAGFTLVEIVVALALLGLLLSGLNQLFSGALTAWRKAEERAELEQNLRLVVRLISHDLENMAWGSAINSGDTVEDADEDAGYLQFSCAATRPAYGSIVEVTYQVTEDGLARRISPAAALSAQAEGEPLTFEDELISPLVRRMQTRFLVAGEWLDELPDDGQAPQAVQVTVWAGAGDDEANWRSRVVEAGLRAGASFAVAEAAP